MKNYYWIDINYACFGIVTENDIIVDTAPIVWWAVGNTFTVFKRFVKNKNGRIKQIVRRSK